MATDRQEVLRALQELAPLEYAESWDNVGLLLDTGVRRDFQRALVAIDVTAQVVQEAVEREVELLVGYHPLIFAGLKRLRVQRPHEQSVIELLKRDITVYSPHTALDGVPGGMNDWLAACLGGGRVQPIVPHVDNPTGGAGRIIQLEQPVRLPEAITAIKRHLGLEHLRVASPDQAAAITTFAVCPGAGGSVFERVGPVDLLLTGEMRHHDVLARVAQGTSVILTDHTNTERGYLPVFAEHLRRRCPGLEVLVSERDADPLVVS